MEEKYLLAGKAGVIGGILLAAISVLNVILLDVIGGPALRDMAMQFYSGTTPAATSPLLSFLALASSVLYILIPVIFLGTGMLAAMFARPLLKNLGDAAQAGAVAGIVAELIDRPVAIILNLLVSYLLPKSISASQMPLTTAFNQLTCCLPMLLIVGAILAAIGAVIYVSIRK